MIFYFSPSVIIHKVIQECSRQAIFPVILPFLIFTLVIQLLDSYLIKPKLFGGALNVPGLVILIAIIVFGKLFGVLGMLIAIPAAAILVYFYSEVLLPWLELRQELKEYRKDMGQQTPAEVSDPDETPKT